MPPYNQNMPAAPTDSLRIGNVYVRKKQATHKKNVERAIAIPRILTGNISESTTQTTGANDMA